MTLFGYFLHFTFSNCHGCPIIIAGLLGTYIGLFQSTFFTGGFQLFLLKFYAENKFEHIYCNYKKGTLDMPGRHILYDLFSHELFIILMVQLLDSQKARLVRCISNMYCE